MGFIVATYLLGDQGDAPGARAGEGGPRPSSPFSPLPLTGSRFWALSQSEAGSDDDVDLASVEDTVASAVSGGGTGGAPVTLGPFIDRALGSPGWTRAGRGRHGRRRAAGAGPVAAANPSSGSHPDPAGSMDLDDFPPLPSCSPPAVEAAVQGQASLLQVGEFVFPAGSSARPVDLGFWGVPVAAVSSGRRSPSWQVGPGCRGRTWHRPRPPGSRPQWRLWLMGLMGPRSVSPPSANRGPVVLHYLSGFGGRREP
jgi:hypothetical protein